MKDCLAINDSASTRVLSEYIEVSMVTIRKDLAELEQAVL
ncbi:DeoR family transcriptional regulator [Flintibacter sp. HCN-6482]